MIIAASSLINKKIQIASNESVILQDILFNEEWWEVRYFSVKLSHHQHNGEIFLNTTMLPEDIEDQLLQDSALIDNGLFQKMIDTTTKNDNDIRAENDLPFDEFHTNTGYLRFQDILNYRFYSPTGLFGYIADVLIDTDNWKVSEIAIKKEKSAKKTKKLCPPFFIRKVDRKNRIIESPISRYQFDDSPDFMGAILDKNSETNIFRYYKDMET